MSLLSNTSDNWKYFELLCQNVKFSVLSQITFLIRRTLFLKLQPILSTARFPTKEKLLHLFWTPNSDKYEDIFSSLPCQSFCAILDWECLWSLFQFSAQIANLPLLLPAFVFFLRKLREIVLRWNWDGSPPLRFSVDLCRWISLLVLPVGGGVFLFCCCRYRDIQVAWVLRTILAAPVQGVSSCRVARQGWVGTIWGRLVWD